jgi:1,2-diacylglycerol 3-beta-galactosyltransferase
VRLLIVMSDVGGGHRALSRAIATQWEGEAGGTAAIVDVLGDSRAGPAHWIAKGYGPTIRRARRVYAAIFRITDTTARMRALNGALAARLSRRIADVILDEAPDVVAFAHPFTVMPGYDALDILAARHGRRPADAVMVADLVNFHSSWIDGRAQRYLVATSEAAAVLQREGIPAARIVETGLPVGARFGRVEEPPADLRARLRLSPARTTALLLSGGDGSGPVREIVTMLSRALPELQLVVVCGRNQRLKVELEQLCLPPAVRVVGFVENMPELMHAADFVITKGGPQTIVEALATGRPLVITDLLPGQEQGNGAYVTRHGAGYLALTRPDVLAATRRLFDDPALRARLAEAARAAGRPGAAASAVAELRALADGPAGTPSC